MPSMSSGTTTADTTGHGITGTLLNGATFTTAGKYGNAVALDGVNDFVDLGNPTALQLTGSMTVSAWIYATGFQAMMRRWFPGVIFGTRLPA